jgi:glyoxylase-like metal-dependent hydrolase (beta-lactamase superfamily II)
LTTAAPSITRLAGLRIANAYLIDGGPGARWLVDTGHAAERAALLWSLHRAGLRPSDLSGAVLTHRHSDHAGNAAFLQRRGVKIFAHRADAEVLAGRANRHRLQGDENSPWMARVFASMENLMPAQLEVDAALEHGEVVAGLEVHLVAGHTEGSLFLRHQQAKALFSGDTLLNAVPPLTWEQRLCLPYGTFCVDREQALRGLAAFHRQGTPYEALMPGHGPVVLGGARGKVLAFLERSGVR